ncbi:hypothetical protein C8R42DRAFT_723539 [Lentinula raphanica]|nr:hypothetical protein C8R42DRAFT_723539 [Lentinula raphanica]
MSLLGAFPINWQQPLPLSHPQKMDLPLRRRLQTVRNCFLVTLQIVLIMGILAVLASEPTSQYPEGYDAQYSILIVNMMLINERKVFCVELTPTGYTGPRTGARTLIIFGLKYPNGIQPENIMDPCVTGVPVQYNTLGEIGVVVYPAFTAVQPLGGRHITDEQLRDLRHLSIPAFPPIIEGVNDLYLIGKIMERLELES